MHKLLLTFFLVVFFLTSGAVANDYALIVGGGTDRFSSYLTFSYQMAWQYRSLQDRNWETTVLASDGRNNTITEYDSNNFPKNGYYDDPLYPGNCTYLNPYWSSIGEEKYVYSYREAEAFGDYDGDGVGDIAGSATWESFYATTSNFNLSPEDRLHVFMNDHGGNEDGTFVYGFWGDRVGADLIVDALLGTGAGKIDIYLSACHSGAFANDMADNMVLFTQTTSDTYGWAEIPAFFERGPRDGEFSFNYENLWADCVADALSGPSADMNYDGIISYAEVQLYIETWDRFGENNNQYNNAAMTEYPSFFAGALRSDQEVCWQAVPGDATMDGRVSEADLGILAANWQKEEGCTWHDGDFNGDGRVSEGDLAMLAANWQGSGEAPTSIPELSSLYILFLCFGPFMKYARQKK